MEKWRKARESRIVNGDLLKECLFPSRIYIE